MSEGQFNKFFRDKLLKYRSHVPDDMWDRIKGKNKKRLFIFWLFIALLCVSFILGYFLMKKNTGKHYKDDTSLVKQGVGPGNYKDTELIPGVKKKALLQPEKDKNKMIEPAAKNLSDTAVILIHGVASKDIHLKSKQHKNDGTQDLYDSVTKHFSTHKYKLLQKQKPNAATANNGLQHSATSELDSLIINNSDKGKTKDNNERTSKILITKPSSLAKDSSRNIAQNDTSAQKNTKAAKKKGMLLTVYLSPGLPINTFKSDNAFYTIAHLKIIYKMKLSYTAGVSIGKKLGKKISLQTGFLYSQINMKLQRFDSGGLNMKGRYSNVNIPIIIGYDIGNGNFTTIIHGGIMYNIAAFSKGSAVYDSVGNTVNIYKSNTGISFYFGLGFTKRLNNKINLFGEPYFMYHPSYITKMEIPFKQRISLAGISFGLKYIF